MVSVCMITYGHENYIAEAIEGVLMQKCNFHIELIIADDCSPDNTATVVNRIIKNDTRAHIIRYTRHAQNKGMINNFIWALEQCKGKYIALCEGDDYWTDPLKLQKQVDFLEGNENFTLCAHETEIVFEDVPVKEKFYKKPNTGNFEFAFEDEFDNHFIPTASVLFRSEFVKTLPECFKNCISGDIALFLYLLSKGSGYYFESRMAVKRRNPGGITFSPERKKRLFEGMYQLWLCVNTFTPLQVKSKMKSRLADYERAIARKKLKQMNPLFVVYLLKSFLKKPQWFMSLRYFRNTP